MKMKTSQQLLFHNSLKERQRLWQPMVPSKIQIHQEISYDALRYIVNLSTKIIKPKSKTLGFSKLMTIVKIQNGIVLKENNKGRNSNFFLNLRLFQFLFIFWGLPTFMCLLQGPLMPTSVMRYLSKIQGIAQSLPTRLIKVFLSQEILKGYLGGYLGTI